MKFSDLNLKDSVKSILESNSFVTATKVQEETIPRLLEGKDVIVQSQTGSGKTLCFLVPLLQKIELQRSEMQSGAADGCLRALIITPTRELCIQIAGVAGLLKIPCEYFIGGTDIEIDYKKLKSRENRPVLCIATPGRLNELIKNDPKSFKKIEYLILDESDKLLSIGFETSLLNIISLLPKGRITGLFSATISEAVRRLSLHSLRNPENVKVEGDIHDRLRLGYEVVEARNKLSRLISVIKERRTVIVFFATCAEVDFYYELFTAGGLSNSTRDSLNTLNTIRDSLNTSNTIRDSLNDLSNLKIHKIHGKMDQKERNLIYNNFKANEGVLFCTDVTARGIDFEGVEMVVHFDVPKEIENVIHRSGRTARNGKKGESLIFLMPNEKAYVEYLKIKGIVASNSEGVGMPDTLQRSTSELNDRINELSDRMNELNDTTNELSDTTSGLSDRMKELKKLGVKAFVSYIRAYKEHIVNYILNFKELDYDGLVEQYLLEELPFMVEIKEMKSKGKTFKHPMREDKRNKKFKK